MNLAETTKLGTVKASSIRKLIKPTWHKPYKLYRVVAAHQGWVTLTGHINAIRGV
jgi:pleiotropic regulator 1